MICAPTKHLKYIGRVNCKVTLQPPRNCCRCRVVCASWLSTVVSDHHFPETRREDERMEKARFLRPIGTLAVTLFALSSFQPLLVSANDALRVNVIEAFSKSTQNINDNPAV